MANMSTEQYTKTYTTFGGCDIVAAFNGKIIGELQGITYSITREKAPVYTMGSAEPRSFSRGKRGIAGTLVFTVFNRDALLKELTSSEEEKTKITKFKANDKSYLETKSATEFISIDDWDAYMSEISAPNGMSGDASGTTGGKQSDLVTKVQPKYADEILPFDITITFANEYGQKATVVIYGVELLNEGTGYSIDSVSSERAYTFVARSIDSMATLDEDNNKISTTW